MTAPVTISAADDTHFVLNGRREPRVFVVFPMGNDDATLVCSIDPSRAIDVVLGSTVGGSAPTTQSGLIAALAAIVMPATAEA